MIKEYVFLLVFVWQQINSVTGTRDAYGTVLYKITDANRKTWTYADRIELQCRMMVGSLIPGTNFSDGNGDRFLEYFHLIKVEARKMVSSVAKKRAMIVVMDALGGYLHAELLPRVIRKYYEGQATYSTVKRLHDLERNIKYVFGTDGRGWVRPKVRGQRSDQDAAPAVRRAAELSSRSTIRPGDGDGSAEHCIGVDAGQYGLLRRWRSTKTVAGAAGPDGVYADAIPFFDNDTRPHSLVVPWRQGQPVLYGVMNAGCYRTLFDHLATTTGADMRAHRSTLRHWLDEVVMPLVTAPATDRWYPALWGATLVARLLEEADGGRRGGGRSGGRGGGRRGDRGGGRSGDRGGGRSGGRDPRRLEYNWTTVEAPPNTTFWVAIVLASTCVFWAAAMIIVTSILHVRTYYRHFYVY